MKSYGVEELNYQALIRELSLGSNFPFSLHVRNHLLAPFTASPLPPGANDQDAWTTYLHYRRGARVVAFGDVPSAVLLKNIHSNSSTNGIHKDDSLWGVAVVFPSYAQGWVQLDEEVKGETNAIWHGIRVSLWISSENRTALALTSIGNDEISATSAEKSLLEFVFDEFVPGAARSLQAGDAESEMIVDLFAVNDLWVRTLSHRTEGGQRRVKVTRANPCMTFYKSEGDALKQQEEEMSATLSISTIDTKEDMLLVQQSNSLTFPLWYIDHRKHISVMIRERGEEGGKGTPVAWGYAHDDLSLASLHVLASHRRLGLGQRCVELMMRKLIQAQKEALERSRCDRTLATPAFLDTEMHKGASRLFFEAQGYSGLTILTWGSITVM